MRLIGLTLLIVSVSVSAIAASTVAPEEASVVSGNTAFATDLYSTLAKDPGNLFMSPHSISTALAMTYGGAKGKTADEMATALHFDKAADLHRGFELLQKSLAADPKAPYQLSVANRLFAEKHFTFLDSYFALARDRYGAPVESMDFRTAYEPSRVKINDWVDGQTKGKIKDLLAKGIITDHTRLVLVNAIYFKGTWAKQFDPAATRVEPFTSGGRKLDAKMMTQELPAGFAERDGAQVLELPYKGGALSMVVILPKDVNGLPALEAKLSAKTLSAWLTGLLQQKVNVHLPKFRVESTFGLNGALQQLGMKTAFDCREETEADFSGMTGSRNLCISAVVHKAFVEVNELGTEAAAATAVVMAELDSVEPPVLEFRADHPFLFALRDTRTGAVLFLGRLVDPTR